MLNRLIQLINLGPDRATDHDIIQGIEAGITFRGAKLLVLVLAIFVASLGLNTNSTAVIIGAMLISPLMGPIIGMGLSVGIADSDTLKLAFKHYAIATLFSILTATAYFLITPVAEAQSELLARTSPTIYDVMIALCGGLAGIIALSSKSQRTGNVIPGVAIATALMPPLCTVGFSIATANWLYAAGAFYLYLINSVFIAFATFIGVRALHFKMTKKADKVKQKKTTQLISILALIVMIPAIFTTIRMVRETIYTDKVNHFIHSEFVFNDTDILTKNISLKEKEISITLYGAELDSTVIGLLQNKLSRYGLEDTKLTIKQNTINMDELKKNLTTTESKLSAEVVALQNHIESLQAKVDSYEQQEKQAQALSAEIQALYPQFQEVKVGTSQGNLLIVIPENLKSSDEEMLTNWLHVRCPNDSIELYSRTRAK